MGHSEHAYDGDDDDVTTINVEEITRYEVLTAPITDIPSPKEVSFQPTSESVQWTNCCRTYGWVASVGKFNIFKTAALSSVIHQFDSEPVSRLLSVSRDLPAPPGFPTTQLWSVYLKFSTV